VNVQHIIAGLEALGWTVVYTVEDDWFASHYYRRLSLPMTCDEQPTWAS
jgi:hypothetical protein